MSDSCEQLFYLEISDDMLPIEYEHSLMDSASNDEEYVFRCNLKSISDINDWIHIFGKRSNTQWNVRNSRPNGTIVICSKLYVCHHSAFMKVKRSANKRGHSKNTSCQARISIRIMAPSRKNKNDPFMKAGLWGVIRISKAHTHTLNSSQTLRFLRDKDGHLQKVFFEYFSNNMNTAKALKYHEHLLAIEGAKEDELANGRKNPTRDTVSYWYNQWRLNNLEPSSEPALKRSREDGVI